jgi:hypothetical protein
MYVYDKEKYSTRINCTELLSPNNAPLGTTGIQIEVYFSSYKPINENIESIIEKVKLECVEMGLICDISNIFNYNYKWVQWANVIFNHKRKEALNTIFDYLEFYGLERNAQDLKSNTDWENYSSSNGKLQLVGRFAEWKYYWTDDCVLRSLKLK